MSKADTLYDFVAMTGPLKAQVEAMMKIGLQGSGLSLRQRSVLEVLARDGSLSVPDIARSLGMKRQYAQVLVNDCLAGAWITRRDNPRHKASPLIVLTSTGADIITDLRAEELAKLEQVTRRLSREDLETALNVAQHCLSLMRQLNA